jgi:hypothetical protein
MAAHLVTSLDVDAAPVLVAEEVHEMQADEVLTQARDAMTVKRVFSDPYERTASL